jgi:hypothetical protein
VRTSGPVVRVVAALVLAAVGVFVLSVVVRNRDAEAIAASRVEPAVVPPEPPRGLGFLLAPTGGNVLLASRLAAVATDVAPVVQVLPDGSAVLRRPAPLARGPMSSRSGDAAIVLPGRSLAALGPVARGTIVELLGQLVAARPVPAAVVRPVDLDLQGRDLEVLLAWIP